MRIFRMTVIAMGLAAVMQVGARGADAQTAAEVSSGKTGETKWVVDMVHSQVDFGVRHLVGPCARQLLPSGMPSSRPKTVTGSWGRWTSQIETASLNTGNNYRDTDLRSDRFFSVSSLPQDDVPGEGFMATDSTLAVIGALTIKGHTKPVVLSGMYRGIARDQEGRQRIAFEATTHVDRRDFGIDWNESVAGTELIGNDVEITIGIEAVRVD